MVSELLMLDSDAQTSDWSSGRIGPNERAELLAAVKSALGAQTPSAQTPSDAPHYRANGMEAVDRHLNRFLAAVRKPGVAAAEQVVAGICDGCQGCPQSAMVCPMCTFGTCIVLRDADVILRALAEALKAMKDPEYVRNHPEAAG